MLGFACGISNLILNELYLKVAIENFNETMGKENLKKAYKCPNCDMEFKKKQSLKAHVLSKHESVKFDCSYCEMNFKRKENLLQHFETAHNMSQEEIQSNLQLMPELIQIKSEIMPDQKIGDSKHIGHNKAYVCDLCGRSFTGDKFSETIFCITYSYDRMKRHEY